MGMVRSMAGQYLAVAKPQRKFEGSLETDSEAMMLLRMDI